MSDDPFAGLPKGGAGLLLVDPPWKFITHSAKGLKKSADRHYRTMTVAEIKALPVATLADPRGCVLVLWSTSPHAEIAMGVMRAWGFRFATIGAWAKQSKSGKGWQFAGGYWMRSASEPFLIGTLGRPGLPAVRDVRNLIVAPVREHSRKPDEMHENLARMFPHTLRIELFARQSRPGWITWGNERTLFDERTDEAA